MAKTGEAGGRNLKEKALEELKTYAALTLYLWAMFFMLGLYRRLLLQEWGIDAWQQGYAIINALVFAKVVLLGGIIHLGEGLRKHRMIVAIFGRTLLFTVLLIVFHIVEETVRALFTGTSVSEAILHLGGGSWLGMGVYSGLLFIMLLPISTFGEISFMLGKGVLWKMLISKEAKAS